MADLSSWKEGDPVPPGMVLGPDGRPCKSCTAFRSFAGFKKKAAASASTAPAAASGATAAAVGLSSAQDDAEPRLPSDCPPDVERLGRHTWTFLHTTASYFPPSPSPHQKQSMLGLLRALPTLYPCGVCATHLGGYVQANPPERAVDQGREALEMWLCGVHNEVNERLGKDRFDCDNVPQRWRDGWKDGHCEP
ncbi:flavin-linked sulfhydryl oxidase [Rhodotorula paludigena]|uniref:flavin-linked sulfhydryl oxidase n=1 Tax=Rhodotorula paludigena TaxID=86838 RepID=UPI00316FCE0B